MTAVPCSTKSSCNARMNFSFNLLRLPSGRPLGLPDWPGFQGGVDGLGRGISASPAAARGAETITKLAFSNHHRGLLRQITLTYKEYRPIAQVAVPGPFDSESKTPTASERPYRVV